MTNRDTFIDHVVHNPHEEYFMAEAATTNAEFWWNHLTGKQQRFIVDQFKAEVDLRCIDVPEEAFKISAKWSKMTGWPA